MLSHAAAELIRLNHAGLQIGSACCGGKSLARMRSGTALARAREARTRDRRVACLLVCYRPLASSVDCGQNLCQNNVGVASETVLWKVQYRRSSVSIPAGTLGAHSWLSRGASACINYSREARNAVDAATKKRRRRGDKTPSTPRKQPWPPARTRRAASSLYWAR